MKRMRIAIDGPAGAGKSTVARMVAERLGYIYIDTGAMYRAVTYSALQAGIAPEQTEQISELARYLELRLEPGKHGQLVFVNEVDVTDAIRTNEVAIHVSKIAQIAEVRSILVKQQQIMAKDGGIVMDGRDIGSRVLPDAEVKVFLTASVEERARRRYEEMLAKQMHISYEQLLQDITERDEADQNREVSPLVIAKDAVVIDTTNLSIDQATDAIVQLAKP